MQTDQRERDRETQARRKTDGDRKRDTARERKHTHVKGLTGVPNLLNMNVPRQIGMLPIISNLQING